MLYGCTYEYTGRRAYDNLGRRTYSHIGCCVTTTPSVAHVAPQQAYRSSGVEDCTQELLHISCALDGSARYRKRCTGPLCDRPLMHDEELGAISLTSYMVLLLVRELVSKGVFFYRSSIVTRPDH